ncbi:hypothetical protein RRG08_009947 [Elysia crispata]|uniref:ATPase dynein-related AAA domain-containing protein n=1 Tax=Elysia crispata TaxID=231223 RepID=A0AAE1ARR1_9GAST|nr:hypothetical protein RRG08_009947 [Elysia crispata]
MKPGAGGGAFEWVDSELVNALKSGHWLLVDNVNFCSASVLDRLNALLEPNGVLTINERGTVDGRIPTIAPHPDFRLFFAMDPKYGEVSRAMRNRGIEIYMLGEDEGQPFSKRDVFSMLKNCSRLTDNALCDWLFSLHEDLKAYTSVGDRPVLSDLLQAGSMTASLLEHGIGRTEAVSHATDDVYVSRRRNAASKRDTKALVSNHLLRLPPGGSSADTDWMSLTRLWPEDTDQLTMVKEEGKLLLTLVKEIQSSQARHDPLLWATRLQTAALIYASVQSERSWQLSLDWLESLHAPLSRIIKEGVTGTAAISVPGAADCRMDVDTTDHGRTEDKSELALQGYESARTLTAGCLKLVFHGDIWPRLKSSLAAAFGSSKQASSLITGQAWDLNQNPLATKRARVELKTELYIAANEQRVEAALSEAGKLIQRLQLSLRAYTVAKSLKEKVELLEKMRSKMTNLEQIKERPKEKVVHLSTEDDHNQTENSRCPPSKFKGLVSAPDRKQFISLEILISSGSHVVIEIECHKKDLHPRRFSLEHRWPSAAWCFELETPCYRGRPESSLTGPEALCLIM